MITFILVEPENDENVGACARSLKNFGFQHLILVNPKANHQSKAAIALAHGATEILDGIKLTATLSEAIKDQHVVVGTTQRPRKSGEPILSIKDIENSISFDKELNFCFVFGPESTGLTNDQLSVCNHICSIPTKSKHPSLNLSQAVMIFSYELSQLKMNKKLYKWDLADNKDIARMRSEFTELLNDANFPAANTADDFSNLLFRSLKRAKLEKRDISAWLKFIKHLKKKL